MKRIPKRVVTAAAALCVLAPAANANAVSWSHVPSANPKVAGTSFDNILSPELTESPAAVGAMALDGATAAVPYYGYDAFTAPTVLTQSTDEAHKTEPDKNTYLVLPAGQPGANAGYDYGTHFLFQGHESGVPGSITRTNLDADEQHRVTLLATTDVNGANLPAFDGSTWDPWAQRLLFTAELGANGGVWASTLGYPSQVTDVSGAIGRGGYEGIQNDSVGNLWIIEDAGGKTGSAAAGLTHARQPNSFVYRFVPENPADLTQGKLQVLQVLSKAGRPITFDATSADADILSPNTRALHTYGNVLRTRWITIHDTAVDGTAPFGANALAKATDGTPLKRPENGQFVPGSNFKQFVFDETGDTNLLTEAGSDYGGFGTVQLLKQTSPSANSGTIRVLYQGDAAHAGFDNVTFVDRKHVAFVEDAGDTLHTQRNALDSGFLLDVSADYSQAATPAPTRFLAEGRDPSATFDAEHATGNDGDNEITGIHASDGDPSTGGILGAKVPSLFKNGWRLFWTQQHGDNVTWEVGPRP